MYNSYKFAEKDSFKEDIDSLPKKEQN